MQLGLVLPAIAVVAALGILIGVMPEDSTIQREEIEDFSYFPMPTLPSAKVVDNIVFAGSMQDSEHATELPHGYGLIAVKQDLFYNETALFYATPEIQGTVSNDDSIQDLVKKGVIVFYYEQNAGLESRTSTYAPISVTNSSNPVYTNSGLHGEYLTIAYLDEDVLLYVYGNGSVDLRELIKSLDL